MSGRAQANMPTKRLAWMLAGLLVVGGGIAYVVTSLPPSQSEERPLTATVVAGDYSHPFKVADATLHSYRGEGMKAELQTTVTFEMSGTPGNGTRSEPDLSARVVHASGAVMVCEMWRTYPLRPEGRTVTLGCDRTVEFGELDEWTTVELTACHVAQPFDELRAEQPCGDSFFPPP